jgi:transcriptional regulator with XRE-family HTH domain
MEAGREVDRRPTRNERLRRAREERNLTQADVARRLGTSTLTVSRWELGVQTPVPHHRERLCRLYGVSAHQLGLAPEAVAPNGAPPASDAARPLDAGPPRRDALAGDRDDAGLDPVEARARRDLLTQVQRYWIGAQLDAATEPLPSLTLTLVERPVAVDDPRSVADRPHRGDRRLPADAGIVDVYRRLGEQLLILGDPGAGKTSLLLQLGKELLSDDCRAASDPMPVVFHLASWASERRPLARWLVDELHRRYGVARRLAERWIEGEQVLPLLDGLDEVADRHRVACVAAVNQFHRDHGQLPIVVCCRTAWYESLGTRLALRGAIAILPLSETEVHRYLNEAGGELAGVQALLGDDWQLRELLTTPLFLSIAAVAYRDRAAAAIGPDGTLAERRRHLLGDYVDTMLRRSPAPAPFPREQTLTWLGWLARTMRGHDQSVFYLDFVQPSWLAGDAHPWLVTRGVTVAVGLASGLMVGLNWGLDWGVSLGPTMFALITLTIGLLVAVCHGIISHESRIVPAVQLRWSWAALRRGFVKWLVIGLAIGVFCGLAFGLVLVLALEVRPDVLSGPRSAGAAPTTGSSTFLRTFATGALSGLVNGTALGVTIGLAFGLLTGLDTRVGVTGLAPGQSVDASRRNAIVGGVVGGAVFGLGYALAYGRGTSLTGPLAHQVAHGLGLSGVYWPVAAPNDLVVAVLLGAMVAGLQRGGGAYLRHRALMTLLVRSGCAPRDYIAFLEYASRLVLLRRRGGGYEFLHRMLLEHFAELPGRGSPRDG